MLVLKQSAASVKVYYAFTCISAPILGVVVGGSIIHRLGGYNSPRALQTCCVISLFAVGSALPIPFVDNFTIFKILIWLLLFFGGFIVPVMTGILLTSVKQHERTIGNSVSNLSYNLLGYLPSPFIYGFVCVPSRVATNRATESASSCLCPFPPPSFSTFPTSTCPQQPYPLLKNNRKCIIMLCRSYHNRDMRRLEIRS